LFGLKETGVFSKDLLLQISIKNTHYQQDKFKVFNLLKLFPIAHVIILVNFLN